MTKDSKKILKNIVDLLKANKGIKILYTVEIIGLIIIILNPLGLPITVDKYTRTLYDAINEIPSGSVVVFQSHCGIPFLPETQPGSEVVLNILADNDVKIIFYTIAPEGSIYMPGIIEKTRVGARKWGDEWVFLGYAPGGESAMVALGSDIRSVFQVDSKGVPLNEIPIMNNVNSYKDFSAVIGMSGSVPSEEASARVWGGTFEVPYYTITNADGFANVQPYYPELIKGMTNGIVGGAQLEFLVQEPGMGLRTTDALSWVFMFSFISVIVGNVIWFMEKRRRIE